MYHNNTSKALIAFEVPKKIMKTFFVLILISFKLIAFPIGNGKAMFASNTKNTFVKTFQSSDNVASFDEELIEEIKESEKDATHLITAKSSFYLADFFTSLLKQSNCPNWAYSSHPYFWQQLYRLHANFRI